MNPNLLSRLILTGFTFVFACSGCASVDHKVYLTWQGDTATTMTVNFQLSEPSDTPEVLYDTSSRKGLHALYQHKATGEVRTIEKLKKRYIFSTELTGLMPDTTYYFVAGNDKQGYTPEMKFKTLPQDSAEIRFVTGGDMGTLPMMPRLLEESAKLSPSLAIVGGDIAYANGSLNNLFLWDRWLNAWTKNMVTPEGYTIPMILATGNHETNDKEGSASAVAPFYFGFFPQEETAYFTRMLGRDTVMYVLDSGHTVSHESQVGWLKDEMIAHADTPWQFAIYHVPLYPSHRPFDYGLSVAGRTHWAPLFDQYGLDIGFENHDHTQKRTKPIRNGEVDPEGTLYLGDGCYGVPPRSIDNKGAWYLETANSVPHFWVVDVGESQVHCRAIMQDGEVLDEVTISK